jgi:cytochrome c biogenesis protein
MPGVRKIYRFFRSTRVAVVLIGYFVIDFSLSTLLGGRLIPSVAAGVILLYLPLLLLFLNVSVCMGARIVRKIRGGGYRGRYGVVETGPDLIHLALLLLMVAGVVSLYTRIEGVVELAPGQTVHINRDYSLHLRDFTTERYESGAPKAWISTVDVIQRGEVVRAGEEIRVNAPLEVARVTVYQTGYREADGEMRTVLTAVYDPSGPLILTALVILATGVLLLLVQKLREVYGAEL